MTDIQKTIVNIFQSQKKPLSVPDLQVFLADKSLFLNKTTVYRIIERLISDQTLRYLILDNQVRYYELTQNNHPHFICDACHGVQCLVSDRLMEQEFSKTSQKLLAQGITPDMGTVTIHGRCAHCNF